MSKILIVQEDPLYLEMLSQLLHHRHPEHKVYAVSESVEALETMEHYRIDLLVTDLNLPGIDGLELLRKSRNCVPRPATLVVSGEAGDYARVAHLAGASQFFEKPIDPDRFSDEVARLLEHHATRALLGVSVAGLLQMMEGHGSDSVLTVVEADRKGRFYFQNGRLVHAVDAPHTGLEAAYSMVGWDVHLFHTEPLTERVEGTFEQTVTGLLLGAAVSADENMREMA